MFLDNVVNWGGGCVTDLEGKEVNEPSEEPVCGTLDCSIPQRAHYHSHHTHAFVS